MTGVRVTTQVVLFDLGQEATTVGAPRVAVQTVEDHLFGSAAEAV